MWQLFKIGMYVVIVIVITRDMSQEVHKLYRYGWRGWYSVLDFGSTLIAFWIIIGYGLAVG